MKPSDRSDGGRCGRTRAARRRLPLSEGPLRRGERGHKGSGRDATERSARVATRDRRERAPPTGRAAPPALRAP
ncbi:hypothetical protein EVAR_56183_1 [Eumeta japonica]|uniref:Uncharacterized protein n=1 Tax=Eumeta variegata TaxID=151549 RepID=A0A4C1ZXD1_EUMVA|nr:hypothetical protein EVAR_56183_1 [Eumeta japonica]